MEPYREHLISTLPHQPCTLAVSGVIISIDNQGFLLDDGTGHIVVLSESPTYKEGNYVRVFGRLIPFEEGKEIQASFVQDLSSMHKEMHRKVILALQ